MKMLLNFRTNCYIILPIIWFIELDIKILMHITFTLTQEGFFNGALGHLKLSLFLLTCWLVSFVMNEGRSRQFVHSVGGPEPGQSLVILWIRWNVLASSHTSRSSQVSSYRAFSNTPTPCSVRSPRHLPASRYLNPTITASYIFVESKFL